KILEIVYAYPFDGLVVFVGCLDFFDFRRVGLDLVVTVHTYVYRRYGCRFTTFNTGMAIRTGNFMLTGMQFMRKCNGLCRLVTLLDTYMLGYVYAPNHTANSQRQNASHDHQAGFNSKAWFYFFEIFGL